MGQQKQLSAASNRAYVIARRLRTSKSLVSSQRREELAAITESARALVADLEEITR